MSKKSNVTQFQPGKSGNPSGRPKGSKNAITLLKQSMELELRGQARPDMAAVMDKAIELAVGGNAGMIKMLIELHISKGSQDEAKAVERVAIQINSSPRDVVEIIEVGNTDGE